MPTELVPGVYRLDLGFVNAYVVEDGDDLVLCDAGMPRNGDDVLAGLAELGYAPADVDRVLLTHYDLDHVGGLAGLGLDAPVYAGDDDATILRGDARPPLTNHKGLLQLVMGPFIPRPDLPIRTVADGETVGSFTAYHTPGHTPGHTVYVSEAMDVALLGDLVRSSDGGLEPSPWRFSYDTGEVDESIRTLAERAPDFAAACVGHGRPLRVGGSAALARVR